MTYSIVGCDLEAREWGVVVQSKFLAVGSAVPTAVAEVGAVATQALANTAYGPDGIELLRRGRSAEQVVEELTAADGGRDERQLGVVDREGRGATFTGSGCLHWAGGRAGHCHAAQGNILVSAATVDALVETFMASRGPLVERLLASLAAGQAAGGDSRGQQSAAVLVVREKGGYGGGNDRLVDLRVDEHVTPIDELARIYEIHKLLFGTTPRDQWLAVDEGLRGEIGTRLGTLGYHHEKVLDAFISWADTENFEERIDGLDQIDPVVLGALRGD